MTAQERREADAAQRSLSPGERVFRVIGAITLLLLVAAALGLLAVILAGR